MKPFSKSSLHSKQWPWLAVRYFSSRSGAPTATPFTDSLLQNTHAIVMTPFSRCDLLNSGPFRHSSLAVFASESCMPKRRSTSPTPRLCGWRHPSSKPQTFACFAAAQCELPTGNCLVRSCRCCLCDREMSRQAAHPCPGRTNRTTASESKPKSRDRPSAQTLCDVLRCIVDASRPSTSTRTGKISSLMSLLFSCAAIAAVFGDIDKSP